MIWGLDSVLSLEKIKNNLEQDREVHVDSDGVLHSTDIADNAIGFAVTQRAPVIQAPLQFNLVGRPVRINQIAEGSQKKITTHPLRINHVVYLAPSPEVAQQASDFYIQRLGFKLSDNVGNKGFLCAPVHLTITTTCYLNAMVPIILDFNTRPMSTETLITSCIAVVILKRKVGSLTMGQDVIPLDPISRGIFGHPLAA